VKNNEPIKSRVLTNDNSARDDASLANTFDTRSMPTVTVTETFVPFNGRMDEFKHTPAFQQLLEDHLFVLIKPDATHCNSDGHRNSKMRCKKGMLVSMLDWV
jgi:hypothetical protein